MTSLFFALSESPDTPFSMAHSSDQILGDYLKQELQARNWSVRYLAFRSGVNHSTISRLIRGQRTPRLETVQRLHHALAHVAPIQPIRPRTADADGAFQRVADALALDPLLTPAALRQLLRHYEHLRQPDRPSPAIKTGPVPSVRRVSGGRLPPAGAG